MPPSSVDLQVRILGQRRAAPEEPEEPPFYEVEAELDDGSQFRGKLDAGVWQLVPNEDPFNVDGGKLFELLFAGNIRDAYYQAVGRAQGESRERVRLRLWIEDAAAELHVFPWEKMSDRGTPLAAGTSAVRLSRFLSLGRPQPPPLDLTSGPLHVLFAFSNPSRLPVGLKPIKVAEELQHILKVLDDLRERREIVATFLPGGTELPEEIRTRMKDGDKGNRLVGGRTTLATFKDHLPDKHIVHFAGHGRYLRDGQKGAGSGALYFEGDDGGWERVVDEELVRILQGLKSKPQLWYFAACDSAVTQASMKSPHVGLAPRLVAAGVPTVVGMQGVITECAALELTAHFYRGLLNHGVVDQALADARTALLDKSGRPGAEEWSKPVLFMRLREGKLFTGTTYEVLARMQSSQALEVVSGPNYIELPIEVLHLTGSQVLADIDRIPPDPAASVDLLRVVGDIFSRKESQEQASGAKLVLLLGHPGMNKTTQMKRIALHRIRSSLRQTALDAVDQYQEAALPSVFGGYTANPPRGVETVFLHREAPLPTVVPIYVSLKSCVIGGSSKVTSLEKLVLENLRHYWPELEQLPDRRPVLRLLLDDDGGLSDSQRNQIMRELLQMMMTHPVHQYMLAAAPDAYETSQLQLQLKDQLHVLLIQPLDRRAIRNQLEVSSLQGDGASRVILDRLRVLDLFDIVQTPSFFERSLRDTRWNQEAMSHIASRSDAVCTLVDELVRVSAPGHGTRPLVEETLCRMAWEMKSAGHESLSSDTMFGIMAEVRGRRSYDLEALYVELAERGLVGMTGTRAVRFNNHFIRDYCCARRILAMPQRDRVICDIIAKLGVPEWLRWWEEVLVFLSGLMAMEPQELRRLLEALVYGLNPLEGDQVYVAARCLVEARGRSDRAGALPSQVSKDAAQPGDSGLQELLGRLTPYVSNVLRWRLDPATNESWEDRARAVHLLGALAREDAIVDLTRVAVGRIRPSTDRRRFNHEISGVRLAAAQELCRMQSQDVRVALKRAVPPLRQQLRGWRGSTDQMIDKLVGIIGEWQRRDADALAKRFSEEDESLRALAALALGDLQSLEALTARIPDQETNEQRPSRSASARTLRRLLMKAFFDQAMPESVGWALATATAMMDTRTVVKFIGLALDQTDRTPQQDWFLAYLIGVMRLPPNLHPRARTFLWDCVRSRRDAKLAGIAVDALAAMRDEDDTKELERIAMEGKDNQNLAYEQQIRRNAIQALGEMGTLETVEALRYTGLDRDPALRDTFYETCRAIYWRHSFQSLAR